MKVKLNLKEKERTKADLTRDKRLLNRNQTLVDVVYGLILFQLFLLIPKPTQEQIDQRQLLEAFSEHGPQLMTVIVGIIWVIIYWGQSNTQFGYLRRINYTLSALSIVQLFFLMMYLYFIQLENDTDGDILTLLGQSVCLAVAGFMGTFFWQYAGFNQMLDAELKSDQRYSIYYKFFPEPIAALITIPFAFLGAAWYGLAWLSVIPLGIMFDKIAKRKSAQL